MREVRLLFSCFIFCQSVTLFYLFFALQLFFYCSHPSCSGYFLLFCHYLLLYDLLLSSFVSCQLY